MISEASKREKIANTVLGLAFAAGAAQSPQDLVKTGKIESPGTALMQTWGRKRGEAERNLDSGRVSHPARNRKKMKTLKEFLEEAYLYEMRKEDKVKGKQKTPMYLSLVSKKVEKTPEGKLEVRKTELKRPNPDAVIGRRRQGMTAAPEHSPHPGWGSEREQLRRHEHGGGGSGAKDNKPGELRGKKRVPGAKRERDFNTDGPSPAMKVGWAKSARANKGKDIFSRKTTL